MRTSYIVQVDSTTRRVKAVVEMLQPVAAPTTGVEFVEIDGLYTPGKFYANNTFTDVDPNE